MHIQLSNNQRLIFIKSLHTAIWIFYNLILVYMFYAAWTETIGILFWLGLIFIGAECLILIFNNWTCPLTPIARRYTDEDSENFDIYLPNWLAKYNIQIYTVIFIILIIIYFLK